MKITLSRDEIEEIVKEFYGIKHDIKLEILKEESQPKKEPEPRYKTKYDSNGFITDIIPLNEDGSLTVPHKDHRGRTYKFENTCKVCGKTFYTNVQAVDCCSKECLDKLSENLKKEIAESTKKKRSTSKKSVSKKKPSSKKSVKKSESKAFQVKNPKNDYMPIAEEIEEFCNSSEEKKLIKSDTLSPQGLYYRYRTAAKMFGLDSKVKMSTYKKYDGLLISKR